MRAILCVEKLYSACHVSALSFESDICLSMFHFQTVSLIFLIVIFILKLSNSLLLNVIFSLAREAIQSADLPVT